MKQTYFFVVHDENKVFFNTTETLIQFLKDNTKEYPCFCCKEDWCFKSQSGCKCEVKTICERCEALALPLCKTESKTKLEGE